MELCLYAWLIHVIYVLSRFLKSFEKEGSVMRQEHAIVQQGRSMFVIVTVNIAVMMLTNSIFSALSPYLWLGEVFSTSNFLVEMYAAATTLFYFANTFFACLALYIIYHFDTERNAGFSR
jgi:hypothetical protein